MAEGTVSNNADTNNTALETQTLDADSELEIDENAELSYSALSELPWPHFPEEGACMKQMEARRFYQAMGVCGLVGLLMRSQELHDNELYEDEADFPLSPNLESDLWNALTVLSTDLVYLAEDLHGRANAA